MDLARHAGGPVLFYRRKARLLIGFSKAWKP
jgi:hypothetical protein